MHFHTRIIVFLVDSSSELIYVYISLIFVDIHWLMASSLVIHSVRYVYPLFESKVSMFFSRLSKL